MIKKGNKVKTFNNNFPISKLIYSKILIWNNYKLQL